MSLTKSSLAHNVKKQYVYKLKAYIGFFSSMIMMQLIAILFSFGGQSFSTGTGSIWIQVNYYSADLMIVFTIIWAFIIAVQITSKVYKDMEFTFVMNKMSNHLSNGLFLLTASVVGGITAFLSGFLLKLIMHFATDSTTIIRADLASPMDLLIGVLAAILFIFLFSSLGYIIGSIVQLNKVFVVLLPVFFVGLLYVSSLTDHDENNFMVKIFQFYFQESIFFIFSLKIIITSILLFIGATVISNRLEVRQ